MRVHDLHECKQRRRLTDGGLKKVHNSLSVCVFDSAAGGCKRTEFELERELNGTSFMHLFVESAKH